jgi:sigma-E factor negative regulatory protein RseB
MQSVARLFSAASFLGWATLCLAGGAAVAAEVTTAEAVALLTRLQLAAQRLNYSGTFVHMQAGGLPQTSRIVHVAEPSGERERVEVLDGEPVVVLRTNDQVRFFSPASKTISQERRAIRGSFPGLLGDSPAAIAEQYEVRKGESGRVAGLECRQITLESRDRMRYSHRLWAEAATGLVLKAQALNEKGDIVEQIAFTQVDIGGAADRYRAILNKARDGGRDWKTVTPTVLPVRFIDAGWRIENPLPGFRKVLELKRGFGSGEVGQVVFSDGLASISVFVERARPGAGEAEGVATQGPVNVYRRRVGEHLITVLGEAPPACVTRVAQAIEFRPPAQTAASPLPAPRP